MVLDFQMKVGELQRAVVGLNGKTQEALNQLTEIKQVIKQTSKVDVALFEEARALELKLMDARESLTGDPTKPRRDEVSPPSIMSRTQNALFGSLNTTYGSTKTQRRSYEIAREEYGEVIGTLKTLIERDLAELKRKLDAAGVPWTSGRAIPELNG